MQSGSKKPVYVFGPTKCAGEHIISIRHFDQSDQSEIRSLYRTTVATNPELYYRPLDGPQLPDDVSTNFAPPGAFYVATIEDKIVGFCGLRAEPSDARTAHCMNGVVLPEFRGLGIYRELFRIREQEAVSNGIRVLLAITSERNSKMLEFLTRNGFERYVAPNPISGFVHFKKQLAVVERRSDNST